MTTFLPNMAVYADVQNLSDTTRNTYGRSLNYPTLMQRLRVRGNIVSAIAYTVAQVDAQHPCQYALRHIGFKVKLKSARQCSNNCSRVDWDVGTTIDIITVPNHVDTVVLLSVDGNFTPLLQTIRQDDGMRTEVYGVQALTCRTLIQAASVYHPIQDDLLLESHSP